MAGTRPLYVMGRSVNDSFCSLPSNSKRLSAEGKVSSLKGQDRVKKKKRRTKGFTSHMLAIFKSVKCDHARIIRKNDHKTARQIALVINLTLVFKISEAFRVVCKSRFLREHSYIYPCSLICYINMCSLLSKFVDNTPTI